MQKLRGPRLVSAYGTGQCVLVSVDDGDEDGGGNNGDVQPPSLRPMHQTTPSLSQSRPLWTYRTPRRPPRWEQHCSPCS